MITERSLGNERFRITSYNVCYTKLLRNTPDNNILATALSLQTEHPEKRIILVSKDINLRIRNNFV